MPGMNNRMPRFILLTASCALFTMGCQEPNYRNEVSSNAQGAVEVRHVAKDTNFPGQDAQPDSTSRSDLTTDQRIKALEAQVLELKAEVSRLNSVNAQKPPASP